MAAVKFRLACLAPLSYLPEKPSGNISELTGFSTSFTTLYEYLPKNCKLVVEWLKQQIDFEYSLES